MNKKILSLDYLRTFLVTLVVFHHSILAYNTFFTFNNQYLVAGMIPISNMINPIIDSQKLFFFDFIVIFDDTFFMSLLFFISGFFVWDSFQRKGAKRFLKDRFLKLGITFVIGVPLIAPLSYYAAHFQNGIVGGDIVSYLEFWIRLAKVGFISSGPLWFLWVLLVFNCIIVVLFKIIPGLDIKIKSLPQNLFNNSLFLFGSLVIASTLVFLPLSFRFDLNKWGGIGPFVFQYVRIFHYLIYFIFGSLIGIYGFDKTVFHYESKVSKYWWLWIILGFLIALVSTTSPAIFFPFACALISFGVIGFFIRYTKSNIAIVDNLNKNIYGIYIFHYVFTSWLQFFFLGVHIPAMIKGIFVFIGSFFMSWILTILIRKISIVRRFI
jgi:surface polysaccharide O-acyltransferase-like enzyme